jgi:hypothetical protein
MIRWSHEGTKNQSEKHKVNVMSKPRNLGCFRSTLATRTKRTRISEMKKLGRTSEVTSKDEQTTLANLGTYHRTRSSRAVWPLWECSNATARALYSSVTTAHLMTHRDNSTPPYPFFPGGSLAIVLCLFFSFGSFSAVPCPKI